MANFESTYYNLTFYFNSMFSLVNEKFQQYQTANTSYKSTQCSRMRNPNKLLSLQKLQVSFECYTLQQHRPPTLFFLNSCYFKDTDPNYQINTL